MKKNKLLIPIFMGMSYRNFITTNILEEVCQKYDVTFLVSENSSICKLLKQKNYNVLILKIGVYQKIIRKVTSIVEKLQYYNFYQKHQTDTMKKYIIRESKKISFSVLYVVAKVLGLLYDKYNFMSWHYLYFIPKKIKNEIIQFDKVFLLSTDDLIDKSILKICKSKKVPVNVIVHSWDNLPGRGFLASRPDNLLVWNNVMKLQAQNLHNLEEKNIHVIGVPQFWFYKQIEKKVDKSFFDKYYIKYNTKKTITYTCSAYRVFPDEELFIEKLIDFIQEKDFNLVLRLHPTERISLYSEKFSSLDNVIIDKPSGSFAATITENLNDNEIEILKFISLMKYSDVVLNLASTISLDAIIFDTPVVCISFNIDQSVKEKWNDANEWYNSSHYKDIVNSKAVRLATNLEELEKLVMIYIKDSSTDRLNRKMLSEKFCKLDYDVKKRILKALNE